MASPDIASGSPIPDGIYTVTLSYQDEAGSPAAQFLASLKEQRFRPASRPDGQPVRSTYRYEILM